MRAARAARTGRRKLNRAEIKAKPQGAFVHVDGRGRRERLGIRHTRRGPVFCDVTYDDGAPVFRDIRPHRNSDDIEDDD